MNEKASAPQADAREQGRAPGEPERRENGSGPVESGAMLFPLLVLAHYRHFMFNARYGRLGGIPARFGPEDPRIPDGDVSRQPSRETRDEARRAYERVLRKFQATEGAIEQAYWCVHAPSAVALTVKRRMPMRRFPGIRLPVEPTIRIHTATDWLTSSFPELVLLQHHCDTLAIKAAEVLRGTAKRITLEWLFSEQKFLLSAAEERVKAAAPDVPGIPTRDASGGGGTDGEGANGSPPSAPSRSVLPATGTVVSPAAPLSEVVKHARAELLEIERYYDRAANKAARIVYFWGMLNGAAVAFALIAILALIVHVSFRELDLDDAAVRNFFVCYTAGAVGAVVSVLTRMRRESGFTLDYEVGRGQSFRLGSFRPFIGAVFGLVIFFAIESDLLQLGVPDGDAATDGSDASFYFLALLAFVAGFSERLTHVVLGRAEKTIAATFENDDGMGQATASGGAAAPTEDALARLERWALLRDQGVLSDEELQAQKHTELTPR
jgi:hypothetical protein